MLKRLKKIISITVIAAMLIPSFAYAAQPIQKDETVYVTLTHDGTPKQKIVSEWLHSDEPQAEIKDKSTLNNIINVKGDEVPVKDDDNLIWKTNGSDIFYQGTTDNKLPLNVKIVYFFDGKEVNPEEIAGKSGKLKITLEIKNTSAHSVNIANKSRIIYTPISAAVTMNLPMSTFKEVTVNDGEVVCDGSNQVVTFAALPGLKESLDLDRYDIDALDSLEFPETLEVTADVENFELGPIMIVATPQLPTMEELEKSEKIDDLIEGLDDLKEASGKLVDGAGELADGVDEAKEKFDENKNDLEAMDPDEEIRSLLTDETKVAIERRLVDDAFEFYDMDKSLLELLPNYINKKNIFLYDLITYDLDDIDIDYILDDELIKSIPDKINDENIDKARVLIKDADEIETLDLDRIVPFTSLLSSADGLMGLAKSGIGLMGGIDKSRLAPLEDLMAYRNDFKPLLKNTDVLKDSMQWSKDFVMATSLFGLDRNLYTDLVSDNLSEDQADLIIKTINPVLTSVVSDMVDAEMEKQRNILISNINDENADKTQIINIVNGALDYKSGELNKLINSGSLNDSQKAQVNYIIDTALSAKASMLIAALDADPIPESQANEIKGIISQVPDESVDPAAKGQLSAALEASKSQNILDDTAKGAITNIIDTALSAQSDKLQGAVDNLEALGDTEKSQICGVVSQALRTQKSMLVASINNNTVTDEGRDIIIEAIDGVLDEMKPGEVEKQVAAIGGAIRTNHLDPTLKESVINGVLAVGLGNEETLTSEDPKIQQIIDASLTYRNNVIGLAPKVKKLEPCMGMLDSIDGDELISSMDYASSLVGRLRSFEADVNSHHDEIKRARKILKNEEDIEYVNHWVPKLLSMKDDIDANKENIDFARDLLNKYDTDPKINHAAKRLKEIQKHMEEVRPVLKDLKEHLDEPNMKKCLHDSPKMVSDLMRMKEDLENNRKIIEVINDALKQENVDLANKLIDALPDLEDGIQELQDGARELADKMAEFDTDGIHELSDELNEKIDDYEELLDVKDELVNLSDNYVTFTAIGDNMEGKVKFVMKTDEVKVPKAEEPQEDKTEKQQEAAKDKKSKGLFAWFKDLFHKLSLGLWK